MFQSSPTVKQLFYANMAIFVIGLLLQPLGINMNNFAIYDIRSENFHFYQVITHMFMHGGFMHILFNMIALLSFGPPVESILGRKKFILYYILSGIGAVALHMAMIKSNVPMVGASGAIFGIMLMFAYLFPNDQLSLFFIIPVKAKYIITIIFIAEIFCGFLMQGDGVGHFAHVGGGLTGLILILVNKYLPQKRKRRWT